MKGGGSEWKRDLLSFCFGKHPPTNPIEARVEGVLYST